MLYALILAGGKGTRLYPLSRAKNPKQFLKVINNKSFLRGTVDRISPLVDKKNIYVITNEEYIDKVQEELPDIDKENIFSEPENKETATCIGFSAVKLLKKDPSATMIILPSDHYIGDRELFLSTINQAVEIAEKKRALVTIGVKPTRPETGYGYIEMGELINTCIASFKVERFLEKPNLEVAKDLILKGNYLWNSGMFVWRADVFLREMQKYLPKMYKSMLAIYQDLGTEKEVYTIKEHYSIISGISVDFGIMQKTRKAYVVKCEFLWDDIGTFTALGRYLKKYKGNNLSGNTFVESSENCTVFGGEKLIVAFGVKNLIIIDSKDVLLVMDKSKDQEVKYLVDILKNKNNLKRYL
ncbi:NTP transferase domain-containing protein [Clostridium tyrobutyricum]|uniref:mannose-1-phosphate guanylyltransferase n=1 Tax=Clostridium tyrobutyricum DIVETGP TaxID=1408889 RepID=W6NG51_CLOTY|nr:mannose-1-phosphate guanylyltransferase [Clostridium tyrobutyricum]AND83370.1 mannose-1-phosphate guanylyltransferase [Clostridium tyrobutyricum]ANP68173.1 mannose-1-phosphate guanylyltransferase [Clostridium tyrobutyricum]MBR9649418.1 mannose-1-phosphate guanylyltransferase [Clostridium tyrobutyricum]MBV4416321.1 mannose-1-phosphate guanylyltransferase [Clostridium tyrobutyricum]MBV4421467.1 mannose-1-phosphate guanylyltransferase [Clostridium tyrobutyricum]